MPEPKSQKPAPPPWSVPVAVEEVAETGRHFDLVADPDIRAATARLAGLRDLPRFEATFDVTRSGTDGLHVTGRVLATVGQSCVVTVSFAPTSPRSFEPIRWPCVSLTALK